MQQRAGERGPQSKERQGRLLSLYVAVLRCKGVSLKKVAGKKHFQEEWGEHVQRPGGSRELSISTERSVATTGSHVRGE